MQEINHNNAGHIETASSYLKAAPEGFMFYVWDYVLGFVFGCVGGGGKGVSG